MMRRFALTLLVTACSGAAPVGSTRAALSAIAGDLNGDGVTNAQDLQIEVNVLSGTAQNASADLNWDGAVNAQDLQGLVNAFLNPYSAGPYGTAIGSVMPNFQMNGFYAPKQSTGACSDNANVYQTVSFDDMRTSGAKAMLFVGTNFG